MSLIAYILFAWVIYRHASGQAHCNKILRWIMYFLTLGFVLPFVYFGYRNNPKRNEISVWELV
jgi:hypothetical protein